MKRKRYDCTSYFPPRITAYLPTISQQTSALNHKRELRDMARKRWLYCHREVLQPLLPLNSNLFSQLQKEVGVNQKEGVAFVPIHSLDEQPKLIQAGTMKDYQVKTFDSWSQKLTNCFAYLYSSRALLSW